MLTESEHTFYCENCETELMNPVELKMHLLRIHGIDIEQIPATYQLLSRVNARDWYSSIYKWIFKDREGKEILVTESVMERRYKNNSFWTLDEVKKNRSACQHKPEFTDRKD